MEKNIQYVETVKPHSFQGRYGGVGTDFKVYFDDLEDLKDQLNAVVEGKKHIAELLKKADQEIQVEQK